MNNGIDPSLKYIFALLGAEKFSFDCILVMLNISLLISHAIIIIICYSHN